MIKNKLTVSKIIAHAVFIIFSVFCIFPMLILISTSLTSEKDYLEYGINIIPKAVDFVAYKAVFKFPQRIISSFALTVFVTIVGTTLSLLITTMTAYPISKKNFKYKRITGFYIYFTMLFSGGIAPYYILISKYLNLVNNVWVLILPTMAAPGSIFLMRTYLLAVPNSLYESAKLDGASEFAMFFKICLPLSITALATCGFAMALGYWNEWYNALLFITDTEKYPLQLMLQNMVDYINMLKENPEMKAMMGGGNVPSTSIVSATCIIVIAPVMFLFIAFQKYFINGITAGAVKE